MNALTSYVRHLIVAGILLLVEKFKLPIEGADQAADIIALALIGTLSWAFVKYVAPFLKIPKGSGVALFALAASLALLTPSCTDMNVTGSVTSPYGGASYSRKNGKGNLDFQADAAAIARGLNQVNATK